MRRAFGTVPGYIGLPQPGTDNHCMRQKSKFLRSAVAHNHTSPDSAALPVQKIGGLAISFCDARRPATCAAPGLSVRID